MTLKLIRRLRKNLSKLSSAEKDGSEGKATKAIRGPKVDTTMQGAYISTRKLIIPEDDETAETMSDSSSHGPSSPPVSWSNSGAKNHHQGSPLIARNPDEPDKHLDRDDVERLGMIMARSRHLPRTWYFSSNHVMVNQARSARTVAPLIRMRELDEIARGHAESMAAQSKTYHMNPAMLHTILERPSSRYGVNVAKGPSIRDIHRAMMSDIADKNNILDRRYTHFGMATARGEGGELYLAQVFRG